MKTLYLIRHAKSSWLNFTVSDYDRALKKRGKEDCVMMANRLLDAKVNFDLMVSSPAKRARSTSRRMAKILKYRKKDIVYTRDLYLSSVERYSNVAKDYFRQVDSLAIIGHNEVITECAELYTGESIKNIPTCGIVAITFKDDSKLLQEGCGVLQFFDFPKNSLKPLI